MFQEFIVCFFFLWVLVAHRKWRWNDCFECEHGVYIASWIYFIVYWVIISSVALSVWRFGLQCIDSVLSKNNQFSKMYMYKS